MQFDVFANISNALKEKLFMMRIIYQTLDTLFVIIYYCQCWPLILPIPLLWFHIQDASYPALFIQI